MIGRRDGAALSLGLLAVAAFHLPLALGRTYFWGDLTYLHFPWKTLAAQQVLGGRFPHWNPYAYMGMPLHGNFQSAVLYPGSVPFWTFPFEAGLAFFLVGHAALGLVFAYLWLRRVGARPAGAILASLGLVLGGVWVAHMPFLNHLGAIAWMPAMMLLPMPWAFGAALGMSLLDGYPTMTAGAWAAAMVLRPLWEGFRWGGSLGGLVVGLGLASPLLGPALRLAADSQRALGLPLSVVTEYSFHFRDWLQFLGPWALPRGEFSPHVYWWKTAYWGLLPLTAAFWGALRLRRRIPVLAYVVAVLFLCLGSGLGASRWVWDHLPGLGLFRYPGNLLYLILPALMLLAAAAPVPPWFWPLAAAELMGYGGAAQPTVRRPYFSEQGALVRRLQGSLDGHRYLLSPRALEWHRGVGPDAESAARDLKHRLYGTTGMPNRLHSIGNYGEPLVPRGVYGWMDLVYRRKGLEELAPYAALLDLAWVLTPPAEPGRRKGPFLYEGRVLWDLHRGPPVSRAVLFPGGPLPEALPDPAVGLKAFPVPGRVLAYGEPREDRFHVRGEGPGWVYVSNPERGWRARLGGRRVEARPAYGAFIQVRVPPGPFRLDFRYGAPLWGAGLAAGLGAWLVLLIAARRGALTLSPARGIKVFRWK